MIRSILTSETFSSARLTLEEATAQAVKIGTNTEISLDRLIETQIISPSQISEAWSAK